MTYSQTYQQKVNCDDQVQIDWEPERNSNVFTMIQLPFVLCIGFILTAWNREALLFALEILHQSHILVVRNFISTSVTLLNPELEITLQTIHQFAFLNYVPHKIGSLARRSYSSTVCSSIIHTVFHWSSLVSTFENCTMCILPGWSIAARIALHPVRPSVLQECCLVKQLKWVRP